jgi:hypothetical protein
MPGDLLPESALVREQVARLKRIMAEAQSSAPRHAQGTDSRGAVRVLLGPDGLPDSIRVADDWNRRLSAAAFGGAVLAAFRAAARARVAAWTRALEKEGWQSKVDQLRAELDQPPPSTAGARVPAAFAARPRDPGRDPSYRPGSRSLDALAEDALGAFDAGLRLAGSPPGRPQGIGRGAGGKLVIRLSGSSLVSCRADPGWVEGQAAASLTQAAAEALGAARASLAEAVAGAEAETARRSASLGRIFGDALTLLRQPGAFS